MNAWRDTGSLADARSYVAPAAPAFTRAHTAMPTWFLYFHGNGYSLHYNFHMRAQGIINPSTADGTFVSPVKETPTFYCGTGLCQFP